MHVLWLIIDHKNLTQTELESWVVETSLNINSKLLWNHDVTTLHAKYVCADVKVFSTNGAL